MRAQIAAKSLVSHVKQALHLALLLNKPFSSHVYIIKTSKGGSD